MKVLAGFCQSRINDPKLVTCYFDEESKMWKQLSSVGNLCAPVRQWSTAERIGNYLYLVSSDGSSSDIYRYHIVEKLWEKLPKPSSHRVIHCLCSLGDHVYAISPSSPPEIYSLADNTFRQGTNNLHLYAQKGELKTVSAAVMNSKLYVLHGFLKQHSYKSFKQGKAPAPALVHCFDPTKNKWKNVASTCHPHFGSSLFVVDDRLYVAGGKTNVSSSENALVEVLNTQERALSWFGRRGKNKGTWSVVDQKHIPANNLNAVEIEGKVYFIIDKFPIDSGIRIQPEDRH